MSPAPHLTPPKLPAQTVATAAHATGFSEVTIRRRIKDGTLPHYRVGRSIRILDDDLFSLFERVNSEPTEAQERAQKLSEARSRQAQYMEHRAQAMAEHPASGAYPNRDKVTRDRIGDRVVHVLDCAADECDYCGKSKALPLRLIADAVASGRFAVVVDGRSA